MTDIKSEVTAILTRPSAMKTMLNTEEDAFNALRREQPGLVNPADIAKIIQRRAGKRVGPVGFDGMGGLIWGDQATREN